MKNTKGFHTELDVSVENHGSIFLFRILTPAAQEFVDEHLQLEGWEYDESPTTFRLKRISRS